MLRNVDLEEISDGKRYKATDMVRTDCLGCKGCSKCCETMADTIILTPFDLYRLSVELKVSGAELVGKYIELGMEDGIILPHMLAGERGCSFLDSEGRCSVHSARPDICRLFPMARIYEENNIYYILQIHECEHQKTKIKLEKWINLPKDDRYKTFVIKWHELVNTIQQRVKLGAEESNQLLKLILERMYLVNYNEISDFYDYFDKCLIEIEKI